MARRKTSSPELESLIRLFQSARGQLLDTIVNHQGVGTKVYANTILKRLDETMKGLEKQSAYYVRTAVPAEYRRALDEVYAYFRKNRLSMKPPALFSQLHEDAIYAVSREMQYQIGQGLEQAGRQVLRYVEAARDNALRMAGLEAAGEKLASGATVQQMKQSLIEKLQAEGFMTVQYGQGPRAYQVGLDSYAAMVARSTTREAGNLARENQLSANGYDLMKMSEHYPTCPLCAQFQGRVYSISGSDGRFPPLSRAFASGYRNVHPQCRHSVTPYIEALQTPEELADDMRRSGRPFQDTRSRKEINLYNAQQGKNRRVRQDQYQYERYKARLGKDAPKSLHAFRQMKKAGGDRWGVLEAQYRGIGYYDRAVQNEPDITAAVSAAAKAAGMNPVGLAYRIKGRDSFLRKIRANYSSDGNEYEVKDILRYTLTAGPKELVSGTLRSIDAFSAAGYNTGEIKNYWLRPENPYNGINTVLSAPNGQKFEVQYHTQESFDLKNGALHRLYEKQRLIPDATDPEFIRLQKEMYKLSDQLTVPDSIEEVRNR